MKTKPIKKTQGLTALSRDHHQGLLLSWKIRTAFARVSLERIKNYIGLVYKTHLSPHFKVEEKYIFPLFWGMNNVLVKKAICPTPRLHRLFNSIWKIEKSLNRIERKLERHIRFEERVLFQKFRR